MNLKVLTARPIIVGLFASLLVILPSITGDNAMAMIACPLTSSQTTTISCGCNPPKTETANPVSTTYCDSSPCPETTTTAQPQATTCTCSTYCRVDPSASANASSPGVEPPAPTGSSAASQPITTAQKAACKQHSSQIIMGLRRLLARSEAQYIIVASIQAKAEAYYHSMGATSASYSGLDAKVTSAKSSAQSAFQSLNQAAQTTINCDGTDLRSVAAGDKSSAQEVVSALQTFRLSVHDLLAGISSAAAVRH